MGGRRRKGVASPRGGRPELEPEGRAEGPCCAAWSRIGLISDTHGLIRPEALAALLGCEHIIHAGDIGSADVLEALAQMAPLTVVRGNNDRGAWARKLPDRASVRVGETIVHVVHDVNDLEVDPAQLGVAAVVFGHSHMPSVERRDGVLFVNPGSAGPRRFRLPVAVGALQVRDGALSAEVIELAAR
jgi:uncharacterized protein